MLADTDRIQAGEHYSSFARIGDRPKLFMRFNENLQGHGLCFINKRMTGILLGDYDPVELEATTVGFIIC